MGIFVLEPARFLGACQPGWRANVDSKTWLLQSPLPPPQAKTAAAKRAGGGVWRLGLVVFVGALLAPLRLHIDIGGITAP